MGKKSNSKEFNEFLDEFIPKCFADGCNKKAQLKAFKYPFIKGGVAGYCKEHYWIKNDLIKWKTHSKNIVQGLKIKSSYNWYDK